MKYLALFLNILLLFFWCRIWSTDDRAYFFNPMLLRPMRLVDRCTGFFRTALPFLPGRALAVVTFCVAFIAQALIFRLLDDRPPRANRLFFANAALTFLIFAAQIALLQTLLRFLGTRRQNRAGQVAEIFAAPFSWLERPVHALTALPFVFIILHSLRTHLVVHFFPGFKYLQSIPHVLLGALTSMVDVLLLWSQLVTIAFICFMLGAFLFQRSPLRAYANDWFAFLMGRFNGCFVVGRVDLTPLIPILLIPYIHGYLISFITVLITKLA